MQKIRFLMCVNFQLNEVTRVIPDMTIIRKRTLLQLKPTSIPTKFPTERLRELTHVHRQRVAKCFRIYPRNITQYRRDYYVFIYLIYTKVSSDWLDVLQIILYNARIW